MRLSARLSLRAHSYVSESVRVVGLRSQPGAVGSQEAVCHRSDTCARSQTAAGWRLLCQQAVRDAVTSQRRAATTDIILFQFVSVCVWEGGEVRFLYWLYFLPLEDICCVLSEGSTNKVWTAFAQSTYVFQIDLSFINSYSTRQFSHFILTFTQTWNTRGQIKVPQKLSSISAVITVAWSLLLLAPLFLHWGPRVWKKTGFLWCDISPRWLTTFRDASSCTSFGLLWTCWRSNRVTGAAGKTHWKTHTIEQ